MIVRALLRVVFAVVNFILGLIGSIPVFPDGFFSTIIEYINTIITNGAGLFFFVIRPQTFYVAIDILFFLYVAEPLYHFIMWVLRKIPFLGIQ